LPITGAENLGSSLPWATPRVLPASIGCLLDPAVLLGLTQCLGPARARLAIIPAALRQSGGACAGLPFTREETRQVTVGSTKEPAAIYKHMNNATFISNFDIESTYRPRRPSPGLVRHGLRIPRFHF
jgi:hypothetical protein